MVGRRGKAAGRDLWNHNIAYHPWLVRRARGRVLDVGCRDGMLAQKLAQTCDTVIGLECNKETFHRAQRRLVGVPHAQLVLASFEEFAATAASRNFDTIVFLASIHHMEMESALRSARRLLRLGGELLIVGLSAQKNFADWLIVAAQFPFVKLLGALYGECDDIGVPVRKPCLSLTEIRGIAAKELPGVQIRRGIYYRYLLRWRCE